MQNTIEAEYLDLSDDLNRFMCIRNVSIVDVVRGAAPDTRRLLLGEHTGRVTHVVAISRSPASASLIENEKAVLEHARRMLRPTVRHTVPKVIERLDVGASGRGLAMTAVPRIKNAERRPRSSSKELLTAMSEWLGAMWADTAVGSGPVDLGRSRVQAVLAQTHGTAMPQPAAVDIVRKARDRLAEYEVPLTLTHGCLCRRHVIATDAVMGVDDWGLGSPVGDPLRDLGRFAVSLADARLPEVLTGRTSFANNIRHFMTSALGRTPVPRQLWREVLLLAQLELAFEALERGDPHGMARLSRAIRVLQAPTRTR
ncbi:MAG TPA: hypothetical protein VLB29_19720 [Nocardioidaceae bacterium]|nr:hypothetical protein [Nocardioidaceae bacterium]